MCSTYFEKQQKASVIFKSRTVFTVLIQTPTLDYSRNLFFDNRDDLTFYLGPDRSSPFFILNFMAHAQDLSFDKDGGLKGHKGFKWCQVIFVG